MLLKRTSFALVILSALSWPPYGDARATDLGSPAVTRENPPLPTGLALPAGAASHFIRVVAADIDADGDLDVVANDGTLDLAVWTNDGLGHLTRRMPAHSSGWQPEPPLPALDDHGGATQPPSQTSPQGARDDESRTHPILVPIALPVRAHNHPSPRSLSPARPTRAPPLVPATF